MTGVAKQELQQLKEQEGICTRFDDHEEGDQSPDVSSMKRLRLSEDKSCQLYRMSITNLLN